MVEATKDIVIALINSKAIANYADSEGNIKDIQKAIKEIYQALKEANTIKY